MPALPGVWQGVQQPIRNHSWQGLFAAAVDDQTAAGPVRHQMVKTWLQSAARSGKISGDRIQDCQHRVRGR